MEAEPSARPVELLDGRSSVVTTCPFFRSDADGQLAAPIAEPNPANRCIALDEPQPLSPRHQRLVCLTSDHVNCPRYLRGADIARAATALPHRRTLTTVIFASILVLIASSAASLAFVVARGGLDIPIASSTTAAAVATPAPVTPAPTFVAVVSSEPSPTPPPSIQPSLQPSTPPSSPSESTPTATPRPTPTRTPAPIPTSDRFAVLIRCPDRPDCWIYTIRAGDNLFSIAHWFGVSLDRIYEMNPWTRTRGIHAGDKLLIPTPTR